MLPSRGAIGKICLVIKEKILFFLSFSGREFSLDWVLNGGGEESPVSNRVLTISVMNQRHGGIILLPAFFRFSEKLY